MAFSETLTNLLDSFRPRLRASHSSAQLQEVLISLGDMLSQALALEEFTSVEPCLTQRPSAVAFAMTQDSRVLLLRRRKDAPIAAGEWCLPGGALNEVETPIQAAVREFFEEVGILLSEENLFHFGDVGHLEVNHRAFALYLVSIYVTTLNCTAEELFTRLQFKPNQEGHFEHDAFCLHDLTSGTIWQYVPSEESSARFVQAGILESCPVIDEILALQTAQSCLV